MVCVCGVGVCGCVCVCYVIVVCISTGPYSEVKEVTLTRRSKWKEGWDKLRENNPVSNGRQQR